MEEVLDDTPRKLTEEEIQDILNVVPDVKSAADTVSIENTKSMKVLLREQLQDILLTPLGITDIKNEIVRQFTMTLIRPGSMVGVTSAEALGKNITQAALNSFHTSGSAKNVSTGVERITELINATKEPKKTSCSIYFKDTSLSFDDIIANKRPEITEITVKDLVIGLPDVDKTSDIEEPHWYSYYRALVRDDFKAKDVLRLTLNVNLLYAYKITMEDICTIIERSQSVICVCSPIAVGKIDIYPIEKLVVSKLNELKISFVSHENSSLIFLSMIVVPALDKLKISGISGIDQIYPVDAGVWQIVKEEREIENSKDGWFLIINPVRMKVTGITIEKLVKLCEVIGLEILKVSSKYIAVKSVISPTKVFNDAIAKDNEDQKAYEKKRREDKELIIRRPPTEIEVHSKLIYADSTGANLKELLQHPDVDSTRTFSNNVHEIREAFGIEAARSFLIKEFIEVITNEGYINNRHIVLLVDFMCSLGNVYGVTSEGTSRQPIGALDKASFQKPMKHLKEAVVFGEETTVSGTSASIFIGKRALVGTGVSSTYIPPENLERYNETRKMLNDPEMTLDIGAFNDVLEAFNVEASDPFLTGEAEDEMFGVRDIGVSVGSVNKEVNPSEISSEIKQTEGMEGRLLIKGKLVRSIELEDAAALLGPSAEQCLRPISGTENTFTKSEVDNVLLKEMEKIAASGKPSLPNLPNFPKFSPPKSAIPIKKPAAIFNLDDFMK